jgi:hypothetical protein
MKPESWAKIEEIFQAALDCPTAVRTSFVAERCGNDAELRAEVENLINRYEPDNPLADDLDNIALKSLRKEAERRYSSVEQFSEDIGRHLEGLPVMARGDDFVYKTRKFLQRHKPVVLAALLVFITLVGGIAA